MGMNSITIWKARYLIGKKMYLMNGDNHSDIG
ncbi:MAG: hypothetical protein ACJA0H_000897 [Francisellaceae bacterium]|jgi:hypothetical protein